MPKYLAILLILIASCSVIFAENANLFDPEFHEGYDVKDGKIYFRRGEGGLILENVGKDAIAKYYAERGRDLGNPFNALGGDMQTATIFLLTMLNRTNGNMTFTPGYVTLKIKDEAFFPMDFTVLLDFIENQEEPIHTVIEKSVFH